MPSFLLILQIRLGGNGFVGISANYFSILRYYRMVPPFCTWSLYGFFDDVKNEEYFILYNIDKNRIKRITMKITNKNTKRLQLIKREEYNCETKPLIRILDY